MKIFLPFVLIAFVISACATGGEGEVEVEEADSVEVQVDAVESDSDYDSLYAAEVGADEYGMATYVMAILKEGPNRDLDSTEAMELQMAHMENINRLAEDGKLVLAGPFYGDEESDLQGIYIFDVETIEEAEELTNTDPAVQAGSLIMELQLWYGSATLRQVNELHKKAAKIYI